MRLSPPVVVLAFLAVVLAAAGLLHEPPPLTHVSVRLPIATYDKVVLWAKGRTDGSGGPLTVPAAIDTLTDR